MLKHKQLSAVSMVSNTVAVDWLSTKPVRWNHVPPALAASVAALVVAAAAATAVAVVPAAAVAAVTAVAVPAAAAVVVTAVAVAATKQQHATRSFGALKK